MRFHMGVDEAGRGPLAGPVSVGVVMVPEEFDVLAEFPGIKDSKQLTETTREKLYEMLVERVKVGDVRFCVRFSNHLYIDKFGITKAVHRAVWSGVRALAPEPSGVRVFLDGLLYAPPQYEQKTVTRGDDLIPIISLASVAAKVKRDRLLRDLAKKYPHYGFEQHKGYPTAAHCAAIKKFGVCAIHRLTYTRHQLVN
jgi:ribonuclease HII